MILFAKVTNTSQQIVNPFERKPCTNWIAYGLFNPWEKVWKSSLSVLLLRGSALSVPTGLASPSLANLRVCCLLVRLRWVCFCVNPALLLLSFGHLLPARTCRGTDARNAEPEQKTKTAWTCIEEVSMKFRNVFCVEGWWTDCLLLITCQIILAGSAPGAMLRGHSQGPVFVFDKQQNLWLERRRRVRTARDKLC